MKTCFRSGFWFVLEGLLYNEMRVLYDVIYRH